MVTNQQVRRLFDVRHKHDYQYQAADVAGMSSKTAGKYLKNGKLPSQCRVEHTWPTRQDPFADDWTFIEQLLKDTQAALEAKTLFDYLQRAYPGKYHNGQLRTLQRRIKAWKALYGPAKEVFFSQHYDPGQWSCSDFTSMNKLNITIARQPFEHLFYHFVLCYSNWQAGRICFSESFESLSLGIQDALWKLGGVPFYHRTDNLTSAVHKVGHPDIFTDKYRGLASHYGFESSKTNPASPHENGDIEKSNDLFKNAVDQSLIIRGSRDFDTVEEYEKFLQKIVDRMNQNCHKRFAEEIEVLKRLPNLRYDDYETKTCKVGRGGTFRLLHNTYSAHSRLVGETVKVRLYADKLEIWYAQRHIETLPRLRGENGHYINYRHHIDRLVRKPGAFENYCYNDDLFSEGSFADRRENILAFGKPGSGKTHLLCGICHELARQGRNVYFGTCDLMVQELLRAKQELVLDKLLKRLSRYDVLMIDDFGYVKQNREEMEVLFTLLAHRYERGSVLLTSNLPFSKWEVIFKDPMTTAAAIDRLVHHSVILELNVPSYRAEQAKKRKG